jgi:hypothetical protein
MFTVLKVIILEMFNTYLSISTNYLIPFDKISHIHTLCDFFRGWAKIFKIFELHHNLINQSN